MDYELPKRDILVCNSNTFTEIKQYAFLLNTFLKETSFLTNSYILDYFVEKLWLKLPTGWFEILKNLEPQDLQAFLTFGSSLRLGQPWPLSLLAFRSCAFALALPRQSLTSLEPLNTFLQDNFPVDNNEAQPECLLLSPQEFEEKSGQHKKIPEYCRRHVKPKKQHEIFRMAELTDLVLRHLRLHRVVDVGSGRGHLSRFLALRYDLQLATIEADGDRISGAKELDRQALERLRKRGGTNSDESLPVHVATSVTSDCSLEKVVRDVWSDCSEDKSRFALVGLHTCGDLASTMVRTFANTSGPAALVSVGCCYMKLGPEPGGFPLSRFVASLPDHDLTYEAKEMACHAVELHVRKLKEDAAALKVHCYRATLELCIAKELPSARKSALKGVKRAECLEFPEYAEVALRRSGLSLPASVLRSPEALACASRWREVLAFCSVRLLAAPVLESMLLVDRLLRLQEQGHPSCIAPVFDPILSPRNHVILSAKVES